MESKYYTPEIEEFCFGFEYEQVMDAKWEKCEMHLLDLGKINDRLSSLRVKYLDREDIESLGFKSSIIPYQFFTENDRYMLVILKEKHQFSIRDRRYEGEQIFRGTIKNKSELKKVLKMIGI